MELGAGEETGSERKSFFLGGVGGAQEEQTAGLSQLAKKNTECNPLLSHTQTKTAFFYVRQTDRVRQTFGKATEAGFFMVPKACGTVKSKNEK